MLKRRLRLPRAGFSAQKAGKRLNSSHFTLIVAPALSKKAGIAVVVGAKAVPRAVDRHLIKRRALEALRPFAAAGFAVVAHARAGALELSGADLRSELRALARESGLSAR
jgi:ribonuclease P protein component